MRDGSGLHWLLADHLGSTTVVADAGGAAEGALRYSPFGVTLYEEGAAATDRRFTGQRWQDTNGLYDYRARWYDPALGRFISADTLVPEPGDPQSLNRFSYVNNNPLRYTDPTGHYLLLEDAAGDFSAFALYWTAQTGYRILSGGSHFRNYYERAYGNYYLSGMRTRLPPNPGGAFGSSVIGSATNAFREVEGGYARPSHSVTIVADPLLVAGLSSAAARVTRDALSRALAAACAADRQPTEPRAGAIVYRVYGTDPDDPDTPGAGPMGHSWTTVDPSSVPNYREAAGLLSGGRSGIRNTGRFVIVGRLTDPSGVQVRSALALDGNPGGMLELIVPEPASQIEIIGVYGLNPPY